MQLGLCFDGFYSLAEMIELARLADKAGMESLWMSDHLCFRDSLTSAMALLTSTKKIRVIPAPLSPYSRHPIVSAMAITTLDEMGPGRVGATAGTGNATALQEAGINVRHPLKTMREYLQILRSFLKGETVNFQGDIFKINGAKMGFFPAAPIQLYMTAVKPAMLQLAGEISDGVLLSAGCAPRYIAQCVKEIQTGAARSNRSEHPDVAAFITTAVSENPREAMDASKTFLAYIFRNRHHADNIRMGGGRVDQESLAAAIAARNWEAAKNLISDDVVSAHSISGTPVECRRRLEDFVRQGITLPILLPMGSQVLRKKVIELVKEF